MSIVIKITALFVLTSSRFLGVPSADGEPDEPRSEVAPIARLDVRYFLDSKNPTDRLGAVIESVDKQNLRIGLSRSQVEEWLGIQRDPGILNYIVKTDSNDLVLHFFDRPKVMNDEKGFVAVGWPGWYLRVISDDDSFVRSFYITNNTSLGLRRVQAYKKNAQTLKAEPDAKASAHPPMVQPQPVRQ